jgi:hypothetical protein
VGRQWWVAQPLWLLACGVHAPPQQHRGVGAGVRGSPVQHALCVVTGGASDGDDSMLGFALFLSFLGSNAGILYLL